MSGEQFLSIVQRNQLLMQQIARNMQARRKFQEIPDLGLVRNSQHVWAIAREAARQARARQIQARSGGTDIIA